MAGAQWQVPRDWEGETCAVLASGPSMSADVANAVRGRCRAIAVNNQGIATKINGVIHPALAPWADVLFAADRRWWMENQEEARKFVGLKVTVEPPGGSPRLNWPEVMQLRNGGAVLFDDRPTHLGGGGNSGFHGVHLATHFGCKKILLCGFDMHGTLGKQHWFGEHPFRKGLHMPFNLFVERFTRAAPEFERRGVRIINCTPGSALKCFPFMTIDEALTA